MTQPRNDDDQAGPVDVITPAPPIALLPPIPPVPPAMPVRPDVDTGGDEDGVYVQASVTVHGLHRQCELYFPEMPDDVTLAGEMWNAMCAVAAMQGSGVWMELQGRCRESLA